MPVHCPFRDPNASQSHSHAFFAAGFGLLSALILTLPAGGGAFFAAAAGPFPAGVAPCFGILCPGGLGPVGAFGVLAPAPAGFGRDSAEIVFLFPVGGASGFTAGAPGAFGLPPAAGSAF